MAVSSIEATAGSSSANSYITTADGDAYADNRLGTLNWTTASVDDQARALLAATARLDELEWVGSRATTTQALAWPRLDAACCEKSYDSETIPPEVMAATFDLAELLLGNAGAFSTVAQVTGELVPGIPNVNLASASLGNGALSLSFKDPIAPVYLNAINVLPSLRQLLGCLCLSKPSSSVGVVAVRRA
jgi:hypothetical protein